MGAFYILLQQEGLMVILEPSDGRLNNFEFGSLDIDLNLFYYQALSIYPSVLNVQ